MAGLIAGVAIGALAGGALGLVAGSAISSNKANGNAIDENLKMLAKDYRFLSSVFGRFRLPERGILAYFPTRKLLQAAQSAERDAKGYRKFNGVYPAMLDNSTERAKQLEIIWDKLQSALQLGGLDDDTKDAVIRLLYQINDLYLNEKKLLKDKLIPERSEQFREGIVF